ncbi:MAG: M1 family metallopeptidase [Planctomycetota bacterium]
MRRAFLTLLLALASPVLAWQTQAESESRAHYVIRAQVEPGERALQGSLTLRWHNGTDTAASELWFHLHHNAYANNRSTHLSESDGMLRGVKMTDGWGWQKITAISAQGQDLTAGIDWMVSAVPEGAQEPDDIGDRTIFRVTLPEPVAPGADVEVAIEWQSQIPRVRRRTGIKDDFLLMSHWFPKLGVFEGQKGWNCHRFHMNTEFYADYGTYDVTIDLPERFAEGPDEQGRWTAKVGASGAMAEAPRVQDGRLVVRYLAPSEGDRAYNDPITGSAPLVHGFAWTADPGYRVHRQRFVYADWAAKYQTEVQAAAIAFRRPVEQLRLRDVQVNVLIQPEHEGQWQRHFDATCAALFFYGLWWGEYPYEEITVVDPAFGASGAGGMEYPTLFTAGTRRYTEPAMHSPESVTVHEAGHQFWYGLVGNNEYEAAWLDEGFNSYTDSEVLWRHYGPSRDETRYSHRPVWGRRAAALPATGGSAGR